MSVRLIYGKSGTGKSNFIFDEIRKKSNLEDKIFVITPEQFSYVSEKRLLEAVDSSSSINCEVLSFERIAHRVSLEVGGNTKVTLSKMGRAMLVHRILESNAKTLKFLGKASSDIDLVLRTITELKKHDISVEKLEQSRNHISDKRLGMKLEDIYNIYSTYQSNISKNFIDEDEELTLLAKRISSSRMFDNGEVYIDEFLGFTAAEYEVIKEIFKHAKRVNITICTDNLDAKSNMETDIFYYNKKAGNKLLGYAHELEIKVEESIVLEEQYRFKNSELIHLEKNICKNPYEKFSEKVTDISLSLESSPYSQMENISKEVRKLVRDEGYKYGEIAVITHDVADTAALATAIFSKHDVPVFIDEGGNSSQNILIRYIFSILEVFSKNWSKDAVFAYIKAGFLDEIKDREIYKMENYCTKWGIRGNIWYKGDWFFDSESVDLEKMNYLRQAIVKPLLEFKEAFLGRKTAREIATAIYTFLEENNIKEKLNSKIEELRKIDEIYLADEYKKSYDIVINLLDEMVLIFEDTQLTFEDFTNLLKVGLSYSKLGKIPQVIDQVMIGDTERTRTQKIRALFVINLNDGMFPKATMAEGFLNDKDREALRELGLELAKTTEESLYEDQFNIYKVFSTAEEKIFLSYLSSDKDGRAVRPSVLVPRIQKIFPKLVQSSDICGKKEEAYIPEATFDILLSNMQKLQDGESIEEKWFDIYNWYNNSEVWQEKLALAMQGLKYTSNVKKLEKSNIEKLYGQTLKTSVSKLEQYRKCPFSYYLKYGLRLEEKNEYKINALDTGSFMHEVIDEFFDIIKDIEVEKLDNKEINRIVGIIIKNKLDLGRNYIFLSNRKFITLTKKLQKVIAKSIEYIVFQIKNSDFKIMGTEIEFREKKEGIELTGKIDRLDEARSEDGKYISIIDYKSSARDIDLNEMMAGTQIQLITYIDSVARKEAALPAAALYFNLIDPVIKSNRNLTDAQIEEEIRKEFRMQGLILADINIIKKMDKSLEQGSSKTIPVSLNANGTISKVGTSAITKEEFTNLSKMVNKIIKDISEEILGGNIDIKPTYSIKNKSSSCKYCTYKSICGFNTNQNTYTYIKNKPKDKILEEIKEGKLWD